MDANSFLNYFTTGDSSNEAVIVSLEGRMFPVQLSYADEPIPNFVDRSAQLAWNIHLQVSCRRRFAAESISLILVHRAVRAIF